MKRKCNLYENIYKFENIVQAYKEVYKNTKNKRKVEYFIYFNNSIFTLFFPLIYKKTSMLFIICTLDYILPIA